jgi:(p)ppGpp synthase/HD superfamily hydrolase
MARSQRRKGAAQEPYVNHLIEVAALVAAAGATEDVICAALLHDAIEDQKGSETEIAGLFVTAVAATVLEVADNKTLPSEERKSAQIVHAPHVSPGAKLIKLADKISNPSPMGTFDEDDGQKGRASRQRPFGPERPGCGHLCGATPLRHSTTANRSMGTARRKIHRQPA